MPRMTEPAPDDDGWIPWRQMGKNNMSRMACCDCGLVHDIATFVRKGHVFISVRRNNRSTANVRRGMKRKP